MLSLEGCPTIVMRRRDRRKEESTNRLSIRK